MMRLGPAEGPVAVVALPLFEEANRTRALAVAVLRALSARGVAGVLPDLPGQGDSLVPLETVTIPTMQVAYAGLVDTLGARGHRCFGLGIRSGALLDTLGLLDGRWHLSPQDGPALVRELARMRRAQGGIGRRGERWWLDPSVPEGAPLTITGNRIPTDLLTDLSLKVPFDDPATPRRIVRLTTDPAPADRHVTGTPVWRGSEPEMDSTLSKALAADIEQWMAACGAR